MILTEEEIENIHPMEMYFPAWKKAFARAIEQDILNKLQDKLKNAERYEWLVNNSFDREGITQFHVMEYSWEPHSQTKEPIKWVRRVRGSAIDKAIDSAIKG